MSFGVRSPCHCSTVTFIAQKVPSRLTPHRPTTTPLIAFTHLLRPFYTGPKLPEPSIGFPLPYKSIRTNRITTRSFEWDCSIRTSYTWIVESKSIRKTAKCADGAETREVWESLERENRRWRRCGPGYVPRHVYDRQVN